MIVYLVLLGFLDWRWPLRGFEPSCTGFLLGFVALNSTRVASYRVFTEFYRVFLGSELERLVTEFLPSFYWVFYSRRIAWVNLTGFLFDFQRPCSEGTWLRQLLPAATSTIFFFSRSIDHFFFCRSISCVDFLIGRTTALIGGTKKKPNESNSAHADFISQNDHCKKNKKKTKKNKRKTPCSEPVAETLVYCPFLLFLLDFILRM